MRPSRLVPFAVCALGLLSTWQGIFDHMAVDGVDMIRYLTLTGDAKKCYGKERVVDILERSGMDRSEAESHCDELPTWEFLTDLYGDKPVILGLDSCRRYRKSLKSVRWRLQKVGGFQVDGLFNVGTNAMAHTLLRNLDKGRWYKPGVDMYDPLYWEKMDINANGVSWGKHALLKYRPHQPYKSLPLAIVRDPYSWMQSMCKARYRSSWKRDLDDCPNLVVSPEYRDRYNHSTYPVTVKKTEREPNITDTLPSLSDYWSRFYGDYYNATFERVVIRFEDTLLFGEEVIEALSECTQSPRKKPFEQFVPTAKDHGNSTGFLSAIKKLGRNRDSRLTHLDKGYARLSLRADIMQYFHYSHPEESLDEAVV